VGAAGAVLSYNARRIDKTIRPAPGRSDELPALPEPKRPASETAPGGGAGVGSTGGPTGCGSPDG